MIKKYNIYDVLSKEDTELFLSAMEEMASKNAAVPKKAKHPKMKRLRDIREGSKPTVSYGI